MNPQETLLKFVGDREKSVLKFARDLIATPSPTPPGDERAVVERICQELASLNLGQPEMIAATPERPNLLLRLKGRRPGRSLILCGHTDTKPAGRLSEWKTDPFDPVVKEGKLYGLGSTDMKGAVAAMIYATAALAEVSGSLNGELQLLLTADEEGGSAMGAKFLAGEGHLKADAALIGEPVGIRRELEFIDLDSRGICCFRISVQGDQMHSSLSDQFDAVNASVKAAGLLAGFARDFKLEGGTVNAGVTLQGGVYFGVVPGTAEFGCDIRVPFGFAEEEIRGRINDWLAEEIRKDPDLRAEVIWKAPPVPWIDAVRFPPDHLLALGLQKACASMLGKSPPVGCFPGATDAPWFVDAGIPTIPAFGPGMLPLAHSPNEHVEIASIFRCARIYTLTASNYLG